MNQQKHDKEIMGTVHLTQYCTESIKIKPILGEPWTLYPKYIAERLGQNKLQDIKLYCYSCLILFDKHQIWDAYYCNQGEGIWILERPGQCLRMPVRDFEKYFGKYEIIKDNPS